MMKELGSFDFFQFHISSDSHLHDGRDPADDSDSDSDFDWSDSDVDPSDDEEDGSSESDIESDPNDSIVVLSDYSESDEQEGGSVLTATTASVRGRIRSALHRGVSEERGTKRRRLDE